MRSTELAVPAENTVRALRRLAPGARLRCPRSPELRVIVRALRDCAPPELARAHPGPVARAVLAAQLRMLDRAMTGFFDAGGPESARLVRAARFGRVRPGRPLLDRLATEPGLRTAALAWAEVLGHRILAGELRGVSEVPTEEDGRLATELAVAALLPRAEAGTGGREVLLPWPDGGEEAGLPPGSEGGRSGSSPRAGGGGEGGPSSAGSPLGADGGEGGRSGLSPRAGGGSEGGPSSAGSPPGSDVGEGGRSGLSSRAGAGGCDGGGPSSAGSSPGSDVGEGGRSRLSPRAGVDGGGEDGSSLGSGPPGVSPSRGAGDAAGSPTGRGAGQSVPPSRGAGGPAADPGGSAFLRVRSVRVTDDGFQVDVHAEPPVELLLDGDGLTLRALWWNGLGRVSDDLGHEYLLLARDHAGTGIVRHWCHPRPAPGARMLRLESAGYRGERVRLAPASAGTCAEVLVKLELTVRLGV